MDSIKILLVQQDQTTAMRRATVSRSCQMLCYYLETAVVNYRRFCCHLLKFRASLFTSNDLWSRFKYLHTWYLRFIPKCVANFPLNPFLSDLTLTKAFCVSKQVGSSCSQPTCSAAALCLARSHFWLYHRKPLACPLIQGERYSDVGATWREHQN